VTGQLYIFIVLLFFICFLLLRIRALTAECKMYAASAASARRAREFFAERMETADRLFDLAADFCYGDGETASSASDHIVAMAQLRMLEQGQEIPTDPFASAFPSSTDWSDTAHATPIEDMRRVQAEIRDCSHSFGCAKFRGGVCDCKSSKPADDMPTGEITLGAEE
jgi:hypothetical protein